MSRISRNISIILRAERVIAQANMAVALKRTGFYVAAGVAVGLAVVMLNIAGFLALSGVMTKPTAALCVAGADMVLAVLLTVLAGSLHARPDTDAATELRDMALKDIEAEFRDSVAEARGALGNVRNATRDPLGTLTPSVVSALVSVLIKQMRNAKGKE